MADHLSGRQSRPDKRQDGRNGNGKETTKDSERRPVTVAREEELDQKGEDDSLRVGSRASAGSPSSDGMRRRTPIPVPA